jgi:hypothetical protein
MNENTQPRTLWSQSMFDALLIALRRQQSDDRVHMLIGDLRAKGYSLDVIATKVVKALGPRAAARVHQLAAAPGKAPRPKARPAYRLSRRKRLRNVLRRAQEGVEDAMNGLRRGLRRS